jgi:hypothetical protein
MLEIIIFTDLHHVFPVYEKDNPEKLATQDTQDKDKQMLENTEEAIKNGQPRETGNIGYTRHRTNKC